MPGGYIMDEEEREPQEYEHMDDINDIFPWIPRGTYIRVS